MSGITYVGHATALVELDGTRVLTDPMLRDRIGHILRIAPLPPPETIENLDAVLISHAHHDHLDVPSLRRCPPTSRSSRRRGGAAPAPPSGHEVIEVEAGHSVRVGNADVLAIPAKHEGRRLPTDPRLQTVGFVIGSRVAFFGDTDVFEAMAELAGTLDVALLPIWGWGPRVGPGHMNPERAARAAALSGPGSPCRSIGARCCARSSGGARHRTADPPVQRARRAAVAGGHGAGARAW